MLLTLKIMNFENVLLLKVVHVYVIEGMIYMIYNQFVVKIYLYLKCNVTRGTRNIDCKVINQHKNDTCHVRSLEKSFTLAPLAPLTMFSPSSPKLVVWTSKCHPNSQWH
jgi:hypothetical protein